MAENDVLRAAGGNLRHAVPKDGRRVEGQRVAVCGYVPLNRSTFVIRPRAKWYHTNGEVTCGRCLAKLKVQPA